MQPQEFRRILTTFADTPADVDMARGRLLVQLREELIEATLQLREGSLTVVEGGQEMRAEQWLIARVARLPLLADRLLAYLPEERYFVTPQGALLDQLEYADTDDPLPVPNALDCALTTLSRRPAGASSVLYLTSDAGEGKTTLITHAARLQATRYKQRQSDWLLLPIALGGRPFLRLDDVVIGALVNRLRFPLLYYDAFIELVRMGILVPALDGFEEMFVPGPSGDAVSALGNLMHTLKSSGTVLIVARKAYFEYKSLETQSRLFDALDPGSVAFARLSLLRWGRKEFLDYCQRRGIAQGETLYDEVSQQLSPAHPLLTRAVLVHRLIEVASVHADLEALLKQLGGTPQDYFAQFVDTLIQREAEKWIDTTGDAAKPLIPRESHHALLAAVAEEMWVTGTESLSGEMLGLVAELFGEQSGLPVTIRRQVIERVKQHALLVQSDQVKAQFEFDHQEFYHYFLGQALARLVSYAGLVDVRNALRRGLVPPLALDVCAHLVRAKEDVFRRSLQKLQDAAETENPASCSRENGGALIVRLLDQTPGEGVHIRGLSFPAESLSGRCIRRVRFEGCYFQQTDLSRTELTGCVFESCEFERLDLETETRVHAVGLIGCRCRAVYMNEGENGIFDPAGIWAILREHGFAVTDVAADALARPAQMEPEVDVVIAQRVFRTFLRATEVNENTLKKRLGSRSARLVDSVLPRLLEAGVIETVHYHGSDVQRRFRLAVRLQ